MLLAVTTTIKLAFITVIKGIKMKLLIAIFALSLTANALAETRVKGYTRSDGTYVQPHARSSPDSNRSNNYGSKSNGGNQRDEYSGATNKSNSSYGVYDNDNDGIGNSYDSKPESASGW